MIHKLWCTFLKTSEGNEHQFQNEHTSKYPSQIDALYQMKSPSEKRGNNIIR